MSTDTVPEEDDDPLAETVSGAVTGLTLLVAFALMFAGFEFFWVVFVVGFGGVLPMSLGLVKYYRPDEETARGEPAAKRSTETEDALEELRHRYARGELSDEEFDRRVERLLETESVYDARKYADRDDSGRRERELERE
jgi:uncharacterized membrane protein